MPIPTKSAHTSVFIFLLNNAALAVDRRKARRSSQESGWSHFEPAGGFPLWLDLALQLAIFRSSPRTEDAHYTQIECPCKRFNEEIFKLIGSVSGALKAGG